MEGQKKFADNMVEKAANDMCARVEFYKEVVETIAVQRAMFAHKNKKYPDFVMLHTSIMDDFLEGCLMHHHQQYPIEKVMGMKIVWTEVVEPTDVVCAAR